MTKKIKELSNTGSQQTGTRLVILKQEIRGVRASEYRNIRDYTIMFYTCNSTLSFVLRLYVFGNVYFNVGPQQYLYTTKFKILNCLVFVQNKEFFTRNVVC